jgi:hypothetical protein
MRYIPNEACIRTVVMYLAPFARLGDSSCVSQQYLRHCSIRYILGKAARRTVVCE